MRVHHWIVISIFTGLYALTFLPYFNVLNNLVWVGPVPQPMAWVLLLNALNTLIVIYVYFTFFKPYAKRMEATEDGDLGTVSV